MFYYKVLQLDTFNLTFFVWGKGKMCMTILCMESGFALLPNNYYQKEKGERRKGGEVQDFYIICFVNVMFLN